MVRVVNKELTIPLTQKQVADYLELIDAPAFHGKDGPLLPVRVTRQLLATMQENAKMREALKAVDDAYCGVGDFEGTGENMASVIVQVREALHPCEYSVMDGK